MGQYMGQYCIDPFSFFIPFHFCTVGHAGDCQFRTSDHTPNESHSDRCRGEGRNPLNKTIMTVDIIKLAKECPGAILSVSAADLVSANTALVETTKREMAELLERKSPHLLTREMVMEKLNIVPSTLWRWAKSGYLVPVNVGGQRRYKSTDVDEILEGKR